MARRWSTGLFVVVVVVAAADDDDDGALLFAGQYPLSIRWDHRSSTPFLQSCSTFVVIVSDDDCGDRIV